MNIEERNSFRKEMIGKLEEHWAKSHSPEDDLFYYHPSEDKIVRSHALVLGDDPKHTISIPI